MAQLPIYLDDQTAREVNKASKQSGLSRSRWVAQIIQKELTGKIPEKFFGVLGTWEDNRTPEEILKELRIGSEQKSRPSLY